LFLNVNFDFITQRFEVCHASPLHSLPFLSFLYKKVFHTLSLIFISCYVPNAITTFDASFLVFFLPKIFNVVIEQQRKKFTRKKERKTFETQTHKMSFAYFENKERRKRKKQEELKKFGQGMVYLKGLF